MVSLTEETEMKKKALRHVGLNTHRFEQNPEERRFAEAWDRFAENNLKYLLDPHVDGQVHVPECTLEEHTVAATVVQWLGSPVGETFLLELGYVRLEKAEVEQLLDPRGHSCSSATLAHVMSRTNTLFYKLNRLLSFLREG